MMRYLICLAVLLPVAALAVPATAQTTTQHILELYDRGEYESAVEECRAILKEDPSRIDILNIEVKSGLYSSQCDEYLAQIMAEVSKDYLSRFRHVLVQYFTGRQVAAANGINQLALDYPEDPWVHYWQGNVAYVSPNDSLALIFYGRAAQDSMVLSQALNSMAYTYENLSKFDQADSIYAMLIDDPRFGASAKASRIELIGLRGDWRTALQKLEALAVTSNSPAVYKQWATLLGQLSRHDLSIPILEGALAKWPKNKQLRAALSNQYVAVGRFERSMDVVKDFKPLHFALLYCHSRLSHAIEINDTLEIETQLRGLVQGNMDYSYPPRRFALWLEDRGRLAELDSLVEQISTQASATVTARLLCALVEEKDPDRALEIRDSLLPSIERHSYYLLDRVDWLRQVGRTEEARGQIDRLVASRPGDYTALTVLAGIEQRAQDFEAAKKWLDRADALFPGGMRVIEARKDFALTEGDMTLAAKLLDSLTMLYPYESSLLYNYRDCLDKVDDRKDIEKVTKRFAELKSNYPTHAKQLAMMYSLLQQFDKADSLIVASLKQYPTSAELYYYRGFIADWRGDFDLSRQSFERAVALDPYSERYNLARGGTTDEGVTLDTYTHQSKPDTTGLYRFSADSLLAIAAATALEQGEYSSGGIILYDKSQQIIFSEYRRLRRVHRVVKAVSKSGAETHGTVSYSFDAWDETPRLLEARVIKPDGTVKDVDPAHVFVNSQSSEYVDSRFLSLNYPGADSGDIFESIVQFEQSYEDATDLYRGFFYNEWNPVVQSVVELRVPSSWPIAHRQTAGVEFNKRDSNGAAIYTWQCRDLPALHWEPSCPSAWERGESVHLGFDKSWQEVAETYWRKVASKFEADDSILQITRELTDRLVSDEEKLAAIYDYVARSIRYVAIEFGEGAIVPRQAGAVLSNAYGDCKDKTTLLLTMLKAVGIVGYPALVTSVDTLSIPATIPSVWHFSHMIAYLPQFGGRFVDPTCADCDLFQIWEAYQDQPCLVVGSPLEDPYIRVGTSDEWTNRYSRTVSITPREKGGLDLAVNLDLHGELAMDIKSGYRHEDTSVIREFVEGHASVGITIAAKLSDYTLGDSSWAFGPEFSCSANLTVDSTFMPGYSPDAYYLWFYTVGNYLETPDTTERTLDYLIDGPFRVEDNFVLKFGDKWELDCYVSSWIEDTTWFRAAAEYRQFDDSVVVHLSFEPKMFRIPAVDVPAFAAAVGRVQRRVVRQPIQCRLKTDEERIATLEAAIEENPQDASLMMALVQSYLGNDGGGSRCEGRQRREKASELLIGALQTGESNEYIASSLASLLIRDSRFADADSVLRAYEEKQPLTALSASMMIYISHSLANYEDAEKRLHFVMAQIPGDQLRQVLVEIYARQGRFEDARKQIDLLKSLKAEETTIAQAEYIYYLEVDSLGKAEEVIDNWPDTSRITRLVLKGDIRDRQEDYARALDESLMLMKETPDAGMVLNNVAWNMAHLDSNLTHALALADRSLELVGMCNAGVRNTRGFIHLKLGNVDQARADFEAALSAQDARSRAINYYYLGECARLKGDKGEARSYYGMTLELGVQKSYLAKAEQRLAEMD